MSEDLPSVDDFDGTARLFPLPNLVLFPHVAQPLHIFEPRYRQMTADALDADRLLAMALLRPGWEQDDPEQPPLYPVVCLGRILHDERLDDGRYNLLLQGVSRARICEELKSDKLYRIAHLELLADVPVAGPAREVALRHELGQAVTPFFAGHPSATSQLQRLLDSGVPLGALCDIFAFALPLEVESKQLLLDELHVEPRVRLLLRHLNDKTPPGTAKANPERRFPPEFSAN